MYINCTLKIDCPLKSHALKISLTTISNGLTVQCSFNPPPKRRASFLRAASIAGIAPGDRLWTCPAPILSVRRLERANVARSTMARVGADCSKYPPTEFSQKYASVLAPKGKLVSPKDVFGEAGVFDKDVEEKTRQAFALTVKKLEKLNTPCEKFKEDLERESFDQVNQQLVTNI